MTSLLLITPGLEPNTETKHKYILKEEDKTDSTTELDDEQCDIVINHMNTIERSTQRTYMSSQIIQMAKRKAILTNMNKKYGKKKTLTNKMKNQLKASTSLARSTRKVPENQTEEITMLSQAEQHEKELKDKVCLMNQYFSEMNQRKLVKMYEKIEMTLDEGLVQTVEYSDADNKWKQKRIKLQSNFFSVMSLNNQHKDVMYLNNPTIEKDGTMIVLNSLIKCKFSTVAICETWEKALKGLSIFVESIPRTVINQETNLHTMADIHEKDGKQPGLYTINVNPSTTTTIQPLTPKKKEEKEKKKIEKEKKKKRTRTKTKGEKEEREEIFGLNLVDYGERNNTEHIPRPIKEVIEYLKANCTHREGIFRLCGDQDGILRLKAELESKTIPNFEKYDVNTLAGTLKLYIKEHKDQVVPVQYDRMFVDLLKRKDSLSEDELHSEFIAIFDQLPPIIKEFIIELTCLLSKILEKSDINKMKLNNILVCMGPTLRGSPFCYNYCITHYKQLFEK